jgi:hypothetical protein
MASELRVDTLKDSSGSNSVGMAYVARGSAKAWGLFDGTGTIAVRDSFNVSGITDLAVGKMTVSKTNSMGSANYTTSLRSCIDDTAASRTYNPLVDTRASGSFNFTTYSNSAEEDHAYDEVAIHGDLA